METTGIRGVFCCDIGTDTEKTQTMEDLVREAEDILFAERAGEFFKGVQKFMEIPEVKHAPAFAWQEDPEEIVFDGTSGEPVKNYEGNVLVFFKRGHCYMNTWLANGERHWKPVGA